MIRTQGDRATTAEHISRPETKCQQKSVMHELPFLPLELFTERRHSFKTGSWIREIRLSTSLIRTTATPTIPGLSVHGCLCKLVYHFRLLPNCGSMKTPLTLFKVLRSFQCSSALPRIGLSFTERSFDPKPAEGESPFQGHSLEYLG